MIAQLDKDYIKIRPSKIFDRLISYALFEGRPLTTSGRWINPLVFGLFELQKKLPQFKKVDKPVFILGTGRSGTTLLGLLLSMHYKISFLNEPKALWHSIFAYEDIIGSYTNKEAHYRLNAELVNPKMVNDVHKIYGCYLRLLGTERVVDKYPELIFRVNFVKALFPDARFLFLIRDGYDTCVSIDQWSKLHGNNTNSQSQDWWGKADKKWNLLIDQILLNDQELGCNYKELKSIADHKNRAAVEWCLTMKEGIKLLKDPSENIYPIRFEDLTTHPTECLIAIFDFLQLPYDQKVIDYAQKVVNPVKRKEKFDLHPSLLPSFQKILKHFNYSI